MDQKNEALTGLDEPDAEARLRKDGPNEVAEKPFSFPRAIAKRLWEPSAWILEGALLLEIILGKGIQAGFIVLMLLFAALNGAIQERRATKVLHSLTDELEVTATVMRSGEWRRVPARELVVGDLVSLSGGDLIPADVQLLQGTAEINESAITGESASVARKVGESAYAGTELVRGDILARVTATGSASRSGKTISLINKSSAPGHLQQLLGKIIGYLAIVDAVLAVILVATTLIRHENLISMLPFLAMLVIATIPIAMPSSFAVANSVEAKVLSQQHILVSDLTGIQEAANMNVLLVDKTGTITANKPSVVGFHNLSDHPDTEVVQMALTATDQRKPSVIDKAIQNYAADQHLDALPQTSYTPFDSSTGYSEVAAQTATGAATIRLGALKRLQHVTKTADMPADLDFSAGRTTAVALGDTLLGVFILQDQPRPDSAAAITNIQSRGVKVMMLTGDNQKTAAAVAKDVKLQGHVVSYSDLQDDTPIEELAGIADVVPEDKLAIVEKFQKAGYIVGMTGDGVNDAPALKQADLGVAVSTAVDLAKRSARMVLMTPGLSSITDILDSGHRVYQRMMTWTITKLSRAAQLSILLTFGYLIFGFLPLTLNAMILVAILNDLVTLVLGTDHTTISYHPEAWNMAKLSKSAGILAAGWTVAGFGWLLWLIHIGLNAGQISTALYCFLIFSAMLTILMTRTKKTYWTDHASHQVNEAIAGNTVLTFILAGFGWGVAAISWQLIAISVVLTLVVGVILTLLSTWIRKSI
ncbi:HAD-IC family P-type ATPase [Lacticaseibacillus pabuli]|uniref:HAD-IC family P-type ATPase n=1 Tax=Lacticaseibacillus pabuli TaxID=3025672 RepID=A0ABY7WSK4_9LACO|nr:HAD-IC family P-type ATPase [Lacticaseibacillus sp. KACC 23028]WDF82115.1 HAD-IC family P-type ATPase [Lacticaseibacillus sp. KACC 23028]